MPIAVVYPGLPRKGHHLAFAPERTAGNALGSRLAERTRGDNMLCLRKLVSALQLKGNYDVSILKVPLEWYGPARSWNISGISLVCMY